MKSSHCLFLGAIVVLAGVWWSAARDWHSTAPWGPASMGWFLLPVSLLVLRFVEGRLNRGRARDVVRSPG